MLSNYVSSPKPKSERISFSEHKREFHKIKFSSDAEILALFLGEKNYEKADSMLGTFGSLQKLLRAPLERLIFFLPEEKDLILKINLINELMERTLCAEESEDLCIFDSLGAVLKYCEYTMSGTDTEQLIVFFLDKKKKVISSENFQKGTLSYVPIYPRELVKESLFRGAASILIVHNHPSGDPSPSNADRSITI